MSAMNEGVNRIGGTRCSPLRCRPPTLAFRNPPHPIGRGTQCQKDPRMFFWFGRINSGWILSEHTEMNRSRLPIWISCHRRVFCLNKHTAHNRYAVLQGPRSLQAFPPTRKESWRTFTVLRRCYINVFPLWLRCCNPRGTSVAISVSGTWLTKSHPSGGLRTTGSALMIRICRITRVWGSAAITTSSRKVDTYLTSLAAGPRSSA